jgi:AmmeMemoRadiSam system protein B/AmmeMemoRadiSam system protein A
MQAGVCHISPYSGSWYPEDPDELSRLVDSLFENSERRTGPYLAPNPAGFVVPHAGLIYSGTVAAAAYRHMRAARAERVVLLGFAHRGSAPGAWIPDVDAYRTPLGEVAVDREAARELLDGGAFRALPEAELCDHSVEIQLPLMQRAVPGASILPIYVGHLDTAARSAAARRLATLVGPGTVLAASSDLTHFGRAFGYQPFAADDQASERLRDLDESVIEAAGSLSPDLLFATLKRTRSTVCGYNPIALLLETLRSLEGDEIFQETLDYQTSGEIAGDFQHSVSYGALGYFPARSFHLAPEEQALLVGSARRTLRHYVETGERKPIPPERITPGLERRAGAFVTLSSQGELRGCVGRRASEEPLWRLAPALTLAAALEDSRFRPVKRGEGGLEVEISVLSPLKWMADTSGFRVNEHGALLEAGLDHGLLLPQVATGRNWTARQFLDALAHKAGVSARVYGDASTRLYVFRAQILD